MKRKIIGILICTLLISSIIPFVNAGENKLQIMSPGVVDQQQPNTTQVHYLDANVWHWQEFKNRGNVLEEVEVHIGCYYTGSADITLSVQRPFGDNLTFKTHQAVDLPQNSQGWFSFDVPDVQLEFGKIYYICIYFNPSSEYGWSGSYNDTYPLGDSSHSAADWDYAFKTIVDRGRPKLSTNIAPKVVNSLNNNNCPIKNIQPLNIKGTPFYGYMAFDPNSTLIEGPSWFLPSTTSPITINTIAASTTDLLTGGTWAKGEWWACEYGYGGNPNIWVINPTTGAVHLIGSYDPTGLGLNLNGLAYDHNTQKMYGCSGGELYQVSMNNGAATLIGSFGGINLMIGIACDNSGTLYGVDLETDSLYDIDSATGAATYLGPLGIDILYAQDLAYDKDMNILYLAAYTVAPVQEGALYIISTSTGSASYQATFQNTAEITCFAIPYNLPPTIPVINGPLVFPVNVNTCWTFHSDDPEGDLIQYVVDWGDTFIDYSECVEPCTPVEMCHTYTSKGNYIIKAKAVECPPGTGESDWSEIEIEVPRDKIILNSFNQLILHLFPKVMSFFQLLLKNT
jgi:hypothetical protein